MRWLNVCVPIGKSGLWMQRTVPGDRGAWTVLRTRRSRSFDHQLHGTADTKAKPQAALHGHPAHDSLHALGSPRHFSILPMTRGMGILPMTLHGLGSPCHFSILPMIRCMGILPMTLHGLGSPCHFSILPMIRCWCSGRKKRPLTSDERDCNHALSRFRKNYGVKISIAAGVLNFAAGF